MPLYAGEADLQLLRSTQKEESAKTAARQTVWEDTEPPVFGVHGYNQRRWTEEEWRNINTHLPNVKLPHDDLAFLFKGLKAVRQIYDNEQKVLSMTRFNFIKEILNPLCYMLVRLAEDCNDITNLIVGLDPSQKEQIAAAASASVAYATQFSIDPSFYVGIASWTLFPTNKLFDLLYLRGDILKGDDSNFLAQPQNIPLYFFEDEDGFSLFPSKDTVSLTKIASPYLDKQLNDTTTTCWAKSILTRDGCVIPHAGILYVFDPKQKTVKQLGEKHKDSLNHFLYSGKRGIPEQGIPPFHLQPFDRGRLNNISDETGVGCDEIEHMVQNDQSVACRNHGSFFFEVTRLYVHSERLCADLLMLEGLQENAQAGRNKDLADWFEQASGQPLSQTIHDLEQETRAQIAKELPSVPSTIEKTNQPKEKKQTPKKTYTGQGAKKKNKEQKKRALQRERRRASRAKSAATMPQADSNVAESTDSGSEEAREPVHIIHVTPSERVTKTEPKENNAPLGQKKNKVKVRQAQREARYQTPSKAVQDEQIEQIFQEKKAKGRMKFRKLKQQLNKLTGALMGHQKTRGSHTTLHTADGRPITVVRPHGKKDTSVPKARMSQLLGHLRNRLFAQTRNEAQLADGASNEDALA